MKTRIQRLQVVVVLALALLLPATAVASDHADPIILRTLDAGITGLFAFSDGEDLALILTVRRAINGTPESYDLEGFEYAVHLDTHSQVTWNNRADNERYGGTVVHPEGISADATIRFKLDNKGEFVRGYPDLQGFQGDNIRPSEAFSGLRDDPFIFPRFATTNVMAIVVKIPFSAFQGNPQSFLIWGTTHGKGLFGGRKQIDHVGRSARSQAGRFDFLNTIAPDTHVREIEARIHGMQARVTSALTHAMSHTGIGAPGDLFKYVLALRETYDVFPDVMIYRRNAPNGDKYPNGRRPEDDIVGKTCEVGDCVLQEVASFEAPAGEFPRVTVHTPPASRQFPYLTAPLPKDPELVAAHGDPCLRNFLLLLLAVFILLTLWRRWWLKKKETPWVRPHYS